MNLLHLPKRLFESLSCRRVDEAEVEWVRNQLTEDEFALWSSMQNMDKNHSIGVAHRLIGANGRVERFEIAAALLHDVGKSRSSLGVAERVLATVFGPRTVRWREYHDHERIAAEMCQDKGVDSRIGRLILGQGPQDSIRRLKCADDL